MIGEKTVLTAAHCISGFEEQFEKFSFLVGSNLVQPTFGPVNFEAYVFPKGETEPYKFNPVTLEDDIALLYLNAPTGIPPVRLHTGSPLWSLIHDKKLSLIFVGYGYDVVESQKVGAGIKREAAWAIDSVENRRVRFAVPGKNTCKGDSGGPAFLIVNSAITQVAVTSGGTGDCKTGFETRVDSFLGWLNQRIK